MSRKKVVAEDCYLALLAIRIAGKSFASNKELKRWLARRLLLENDTKSVGVKKAKRIFWSLAVANGFIQRRKVKGKTQDVIISEKGLKFLWADEFKRYNLFNGSKPSEIYKSKNLLPIKNEEGNTNISLNNAGYEYIVSDLKNIKPKIGQAGLIYLVIGFSDAHEGNYNSSVIYMEVKNVGQCHIGSKTPEIYMFDSVSGKGFIRAGDDMVPVGPGICIFIPSGMNHYLIPSAGEILKVWVVAPTGWENEKDFIRGKEIKDISSIVAEG